MMKNEYIGVCQDTLALLERRWGAGVSVEQKNVLANTEPTLKKAQAVDRWEARCLSPWTWARLAV